jgi:hypothetical protein
MAEYYREFVAFFVYRGGKVVFDEFSLHVETSSDIGFEY